MHSYLDGVTYFITLECRQRQQLLAQAEVKQLLLTAIQETKKQFSLHLGGFAILDDHAHMVFVFATSRDFHAPMNYLRARFLRAYHALHGDNGVTTFWEHQIKARQLADDADLRAHLDYVHYDPVHHGACRRPADYPWSSLPLRIEQGWYPEEWGSLGPPASLGRFAPHGG